MMGNSIVTAIANGSAPYLANEVKNQIQGNSVERDIQRTIAHGLLNAGLALAKGENAADAKPIIKGLEKGYESCMKNATCRNSLMQLEVNFGLTSAQIQEAMDAGSEPWGDRLGIPSHTGGNQIHDQLWTDTGGDQIPKPTDNLTGIPIPEVPNLDDLVYLDKITQGEHAIEDALKKNLEASQKGNESSKFGDYLTKEEQIFATKAHQELINEIGKSNTQAEKIAIMIGAYDSKTAVGYSNKAITADSLHPTTVDYIKKQLGVE